MLLTAQPIPKTIEDLAQEVAEDTLLTRLEHQRALQEAAIRAYKADSPIVGAVQPSAAPTPEETDDDDEVDDMDNDDYIEEDEEETYEEEQ